MIKVPESTKKRLNEWGGIIYLKNFGMVCAGRDIVTGWER